MSETLLKINNFDLSIPIGSGLIWVSDNIPKGFGICDGRLFDKNTYPELYNALGGANSPWGDSKLPDLRELVPVGIGTSSNPNIKNHKTYTLGQFRDDHFQGHGHSGLGVDTKKWHCEWQSRNYTYNKTNIKTTGIVTKEGYSTPRTGDVTREKRIGVHYIIRME